MDFVSNCRKFIGIDSTPSHGTREQVALVQRFCTDRNLHFEIQEAVHDGIEQANIIVRTSKERPDSEFLFQTHLDTSDPGPLQLWTKTDQNPFDATIVDGRIYGLGTADVKLDFLCKLEAISKFSQQKAWKLPPVLVGTFGEETGMAGAMKLIRGNKISPKFALISEPTNMRLVSTAKGIATVEIKIPFSEAELEYRRDHNLRESTSTQSRVFHGKAAHSSTPHLGESAASKMFEYLMQMPEDISLMEIDGGTNFNTVPTHAFIELEPNTISDSIAGKIIRIYKYIKGLEHEFSLYKDNDFQPSSPTMNIGIIRTHENHVFISGTCRIPPIVTQNIYEKWMHGLSAHCAANGSEFRVTDYKRPFRTERNTILLKGCADELRALNLNTEPTSQPSTNEASLFSRIGIECVCFGPGEREGNIHTPNESVAIADLEKATVFYTKVIERFCL